MEPGLNGRPAAHRNVDVKSHDRGEGLAVAIHRRTSGLQGRLDQGAPWLRYMPLNGLSPTRDEIDIRGSATLTLTVRPAKVYASH